MSYSKRYFGPVQRTKPLPQWFKPAKGDETMGNELTEYKAAPPSLNEVVFQYLDSFGNKLTAQHRNQFIQICSAFGLNPFIREIYGIPFGDKFNIIVGYEVYLKRAEASGKLAGWKAWTEGEGRHLKGCISITRKDWTEPFYHEVLLVEYDQANSMWKQKPATMLKKVAIAQGFRMCFPAELGGIPYTSDEIPAPDAAPVLPEPKPKKQARDKAEVVQESAPLPDAEGEGEPKPYLLVRNALAADDIPPPATITRIQAKELCDMIRDNDIPLQKLLDYLKTDQLSTVLVNNLPRIHNWILENSAFPDPPDYTKESFWKDGE